MILGIGNDIIDIRRIEKSIERFGERFIQRVFTDEEQAKANTRQKAGLRIIASTYAKRFAAKEACVKALGTGEGISWKEMEVVSLPCGKPSLTLTGNALKQLQILTPAEKTASIHLSMADDYPTAQAFVVISAE